MPATLQEVKQLIQNEFPAANVNDLKAEDHRITGDIIWSGFENKEIKERYRLMSERVRDKLGLSGINVGNLLLLAPGEKI